MKNAAFLAIALATLQATANGQLFDVTAHPYNATANNSADDDAGPFREALHDAMAYSGPATVQIPEGTYHFRTAWSWLGNPETPEFALAIGGKFAFPSLYRASSIHVVGLGAGGADIVLVDTPLNDLDRTGLLLIESKPNITIEGISVFHEFSSGEPSTFTQGIIADASNTYTDIDIEPGYAVPETGYFPNQTYAFGRVMDPVSFDLVPHCANRVVTNISQVAAPLGMGPRYRLSHQAVVNNDEAAIGDVFVLPRPQNYHQGSNVLWKPPAIFIVGALNCKITDVEVNSSPNMGILATGVEDLEITATRIIPKALAQGQGGMQRLVSTNRDGIHVYTARGETEVSGCELKHTGDDAITIHGTRLQVRGTPTNSDTVTLCTNSAAGLNLPMVGDRIVAYNGVGVGGNPQTVEMIVVEIISTSTCGSGFDDVQLRLRKPVTLMNDQQVHNLDSMASHFAIRDNTCENSSSRGLLINASFGVIEGNEITRSYGTGISLLATPKDIVVGGASSGASESVLIRGNTITQAGSGRSFNESLRGGINVYLDDMAQVWESADLFGEIFIEGNVLASIVGPSILISNASNVTVAGNLFQDADATTLGDVGDRQAQLHALVDLEWVNGVTFSDNLHESWINPANELPVHLHGTNTRVFGIGPGSYSGFREL